MSVRKRNSRWYIDFRLKGRRYREAIPEARTKYEAQQAEATKRKEIFERRYGPPKDAPLLKDFIKRHYIPFVKANHLSAKHSLQYAAIITKMLGHYHLDEITPLAVERFKRARKETPLHRGTRKGEARANSTVNLEVSALSKMLSMAVDSGLLAANPCSRVKRLRPEPHRTRYLTPDEEVRLFDALDTRLRAIATVALNTGMRRSEILSLRWADVDFARGIIYVRKTKTGRDRTLPLNEATRTALQQQAGGHDEWVFTGKYKRTHLAPGDPLYGFRAACRAVGISGLRFHDLRHTFATRLADASVDVLVIARLLGHSNLNMTARYAHTSEDAKRAAVEVLKARHTLVTKQEQVAGK